ncbi:MFS general substrate transporter, partial [Massarina eburnea CBS 473.64]
MSTATSTIELTELPPTVPKSDTPTIPTPGRTLGSTPQISTTNSSLDIPSTPSSNEAAIALAQNTTPPLRTARLILTVLQPSLVSFFASFTNGVVTVGLPVIARSIDLPRSLYLWPASVYGLASGATLLIAGAVADIVGARNVELVGIWLLGAFTLSCGLAQTGIQLVVFRALQGVAVALHLPCSVSLIAAAVPSGKARNVAFASLGLSQPLGFSFGLVFGGIMVDKVGWRSGFYLCGASLLVVAVVAYWGLPKVKVAEDRGERSVWGKLRSEIDWVGGILASGGLAILAYVLAILSADLTTIKSPATASLLAVSFILLITFPLWMHTQEKAGRPALIRNSMWKNIPFSATCIMMALSWGVINAIEIFSSLYFQEIQSASTLAASLYLLPNLAFAVCINLVIGWVVDRIPARWLISGSAFICAVSPLMMALVDPAWPYWYLEFWAQIFAPFSGNVLFTTGLIIVSDSFPEKTQALAGAIFNAVAQFGYCIGVGVFQVVALSVMGTEGSAGGGEAFDNVDIGRTLAGYRASFWTMFAFMIVCGLVGVVGLRKAGKVGLKKE